MSHNVDGAFVKVYDGGQGGLILNDQEVANLLGPGGRRAVQIGILTVRGVNYTIKWQVGTVAEES